MNRSNLQLPRARLIAVLVPLLLVGCTVAPEPLGLSERASHLNADRALMFTAQEPINGPVDLPQAMARAIKYNLDARLKLMEEGIANRQLDVSRYDLLPKLTGQAGWYGRDSYPASSSMAVDTNTQSLVPSTSQDKSHHFGDLNLTWNVLDFGVSYYQARQQADRALIAKERKRKAVQNLMQQVRQAYWFAVGAQKLEPKIATVLADVTAALKDSRTIEDENLRSPIEALSYRRQLLETVRQLEIIRDELAQARPRLAALINAEPGKPLELVSPDVLALTPLKGTLPQMEEAALLYRPELLEANYNERIGVLETRKAVAKLLPGVELSLGGHYDSNSFLVDSNWKDAGLRISWNIFNLLSASSIRGTAEAQLELAKTQRLALNMAVLSQVYVGYRDLAGRQRQFELAQDLDSLDRALLEHTRNAANNAAQGKLNETRAAVNAVLSELRVYQTYGQYQNAYGQMLATLGMDPLPNELPSNDVKTVTEALKLIELEFQSKPVTEWALAKAGS